ncbi:MAG: NAD(P)H-dependent oxidoreductase, partial [Rhizobiales bacterium]|nr:NAD(P)H-dependent oxidoreductase [Hyphomicrobiales bacterium]
MSRPSRTRVLVEAVVSSIERQGGGNSAVYDLIDAGPGLGAAFTHEALTVEARAMLEAIVGADVLVVGSPVYKGS